MVVWKRQRIRVACFEDEFVFNDVLEADEAESQKSLHLVVVTHGIEEVAERSFFTGDVRGSCGKGELSAPMIERLSAVHSQIQEGIADHRNVSLLIPL